MFCVCVGGGGGGGGGGGVCVWGGGGWLFRLKWNNKCVQRELRSKSPNHGAVRCADALL